jgi:hemerythrin superfamily protein
MTKISRRWSKPLEKLDWIWVTPALVTAGSLGIYWAARHWSKGEPDAISVLKEDHRRIEELFVRFENSRNPEERQELMMGAILELQIHGLVEDELFYPALREFVDFNGTDLSEAEHQEMNELMAALFQLDAGHPSFLSKARELVTKVRNHIDYEEAQVLPRLKASEIDLKHLGRGMMQRQKDFRRQLQLPSITV